VPSLRLRLVLLLVMVCWGRPAASRSNPWAARRTNRGLTGLGPREGQRESSEERLGGPRGQGPCHATLL